MPHKHPFFEIKKSEDGQYYFTLVSRNGEAILTSETYKKKSAAKDGIDAIVREAAWAVIEDSTRKKKK